MDTYENKRSYTTDELANAMQVQTMHIRNPHAGIHSLAYDSRRLYHAEESLFFAIRGLRDGHDFVEHAYAQGVRNFVVSRQVKPLAEACPEANFLEVEDSLRALQQLAAHHRSKFSIPVIAITGSNGKTIVKDWLFQLLSPDYCIVRSPKSYNSQLGVPLSVWEIDSSHELAIIEAGISLPGEMRALNAVIRPDIAVLTNVGSAHQEGFESQQQKIEEKLILLQDTPLIVYPAEAVGSYLPVHEAYRIHPTRRDHRTHRTDRTHQDRWSWGRAPSDRLQITGQTRVTHQGRPATRIQVRVVDTREAGEVVIPFTDAASIENALTCWAVLLALGYEQDTIRDRMSRLQVMEMRLEMKQGIQQSTLIDDSYSNDLSSLGIALDFLRQQQQHSARTLILSDLPQAVGRTDEVYAEVRALLKRDPPDRLISAGPELAARQGTFPVREHLAFETTEQLLDALASIDFRDQTVLLKGARKFTFEQISARLVAKSHETVMEINLNALEHNVLKYKAALGPAARIMVMVKAFSYGSGSFEIAGMLQRRGVDYLAVAYADEGVALRQAGITLPIMVMAPDRSSFASLRAHALQPELFSFSILEDWIRWLQGQGVRDYPVHIKLDTGMHRLGFEPSDMERLAERLANQTQLRVESVFSHFVASGDSIHDAFTRTQLALFSQMADQLAERLDQPFLRHMANTDAIVRFPETHLDLVRVGIGLYGVSGGAGLDLQPAIRLKTTVMQIKQLPAGDTIGYHRRGRLARESRIATVQVGYADGYDRRFGNGVGTMYIQGYPVPTIGDICMDMCMLDVTDLPVPVLEGDEVLVYGDEAAIHRLAESIGTIPYELLVNVSQRVKRVYYYG